MRHREDWIILWQRFTDSKCSTLFERGFFMFKKSLILPLLLIVAFAAVKFVSYSDAQLQPNFQFVDCVPVQVAVFTDRAHVACQSGVGEIVYFAVSTQEVNLVTWYLTIITDAMNSRKNLRIYVDLNDVNGVLFGCGIEDCRMISGILASQ
jgi:hypothetical protein